MHFKRVSTIIPPPTEADRLLGNPTCDQVFSLTDEEILLISCFRAYKHSLTKAGQTFKWMTSPYSQQDLDLIRIDPVQIQLKPDAAMTVGRLEDAIRHAPEDAPVMLLSATGKPEYSPIRMCTVGSINPRDPTIIVALIK